MTGRHAERAVAARLSNAVGFALNRAIYIRRGSMYCRGYFGLDTILGAPTIYCVSNVSLNRYSGMSLHLYRRRKYKRAAFILYVRNMSSDYLGAYSSAIPSCSDYQMTIS
ncbi:hypothetical protein DBV15_09791 [Temnothorax longispinosus]|uniref:Uncharacterized protein n=1 Tax=Temnothorax longispinosus TaxID=300112 RepID=A0A4S2JRG9_9HYME|nr:hypothetical protein DBV15_09791 [Temnothorax longispinosus]